MWTIAKQPDPCFQSSSYGWSHNPPIWGTHIYGNPHMVWSPGIGWPDLSIQSLASSAVSSRRPKLMDLLMLAAQPMLCSWKHWNQGHGNMDWALPQLQDGMHPEGQNMICVCVYVSLCVLCVSYRVFLNETFNIPSDRYGLQHGKHKPSDVWLQESTRSLLAYPGFARGIAHTRAKTHVSNRNTEPRALGSLREWK